MRILLDLQGCQTESRYRGIGRYSTALAEAMVRQAGDHEVWILLNDVRSESIGLIRETFGKLMPVERIVSFAVPSHTHFGSPDNRWRRSAAELIRESFLAGLQPDIVHVCSLFEGAQEEAVVSIGRGDVRMPTAVTLYDLIPLLNPRDYLAADWVREWYMHRVESLRAADLLLAISGHAREEALAALGFQPDRIVNISSAVSDLFKPVPVDDALRKRLSSHFGVRCPFVLYSCAFESRKNVDRLLQAFAAMPSEVSRAHQLVIAGKVSAEERARLERLAHDLRIDDRFVLTGYVEDDDLLRLYSATSLYVFPSLHEGFGLPALEAMACGAPTIGSGTTSVPEVIGREDALFDPTNVEEIAQLMQRGLTDAPFIASLRAHAPAQAGRFSWDACARTAIEAFERVHAAQQKAGRRVVNPHLSTARGVESQLRAIAALDAGVSPTDSDLAYVARAIERNRAYLDTITRGVPLPDSIAWRVEGPFDSSYSLALVNREVGKALADDGQAVALHSTEGPGDFDPSAEFLCARPDLDALHRRRTQLTPREVDVTSRNLYPPRVADMVSPIDLLHCYAWEETGFPPEWVDDFNRNLHGVAVVSSHVEKLLIDNGVGVPISVVGNGTDHWDRITADPTYQVPGKPVRFLHVSSCFPRKGADTLLQAWGRAFRASDDVTLVVKTFANPHNRIHDWLADARRDDPGFPDVVIVEDDLGDAQLKALYEGCHALVAPSRAEGYGLPLAEAMLSGLPVIATAWSGQLDFCTPDTAWLVDYTFAPAQTHFALSSSAWADPDPDDLARAMREVYVATPEMRAEKVERGRALLRERHTWAAVADRLVASTRDIAVRAGSTPPRFGVVSTWHTRCGIAAYTEHLLGETELAPIVFAMRDLQLEMPDDDRVVRCWNGKGPLDEVAASIDEAGIDILLLQFQYSFFEFEGLAAFLEAQVAKGRTVVVELHATVDPPGEGSKRLVMLASALRKCARVLVHSIADLNRLKKVGVVDNVALFPHGLIDVALPAPVQSGDGAFTLATYGFFLPHKGLPEIVEAVGLLVARGVDVRLRMVNAEYPVDVSRDHIAHVRARIQALGIEDRVTLVTDFLSDADSFAALAQADAVAFAYQDTGESASGAVRHGLAVGRPVLVTPIPIFDDVRPAVFTLPGTMPEDLAAGVEAFIEQHRARTTAFGETMDRAARWRDAHRYSRLGARLEHMLLQLHRRSATQRTQTEA